MVKLNFNLEVQGSLKESFLMAMIIVPGETTFEWLFLQMV